MEPWPHAVEAEELKVGWRRLTKSVQWTGRQGSTNITPKESVGDRCIATIALTSSNTVIVAEQFGQGQKKYWELLGGGCEKNEDIGLLPRENYTETGYSAGSIKYLGAAFKDAYSNTTSYYFCT